MTDKEKLSVINGMTIVDADISGGEVVYVLVDYNEENIQKLSQVVPDVEEYIKNNGDPDRTKETIDISTAAFFHVGADYYAKGRFFIQGEISPKDLEELSKLRIKRAKYKAIDENGDVRFVTQYTNGAYTIYVNEIGNHIYANIGREDYGYPVISNSGINIGSTGTLSLDELDKHIERLAIAKRTYKQIKGMFEGIFIR